MTDSKKPFKDTIKELQIHYWVGVFCLAAGIGFVSPNFLAGVLIVLGSSIILYVSVWVMYLLFSEDFKRRD